MRVIALGRRGSKLIFSLILEKLSCFGGGGFHHVFFHCHLENEM